MGSDRCDLTELPKRFCSHCTGADAREQLAKRVQRPSGGMSAPFPARFAGTCNCGEPIVPGELIRRDEDGGWLRMKCCGEGVA
jgi:hypothetical protein